MGTKLSRRRFLQGMAAGGALILAGGLRVNVSGQAANRELRLGYPWDVKTLDPRLATIGSDNLVVANVFDGLLNYEPGTRELKPGLAERWEVSPDGTVYTFFLRPNVPWHDGYGTFSAEDVKFHYDSLLDPRTGATYGSLYGMLEAVEIVDPLTVRFRLKRAYAPFLYLVSAYRSGHIVSAKAAAERGDDFGQQPVGTGPFRFERWVPRTEYVLEANPLHWSRRPKVDKVRVIPITEASTMLAALKRGELDLIFIDDPQFFTAVAQDPQLKAVRLPSLFAFYLSLNTKLGPTSDPRVRQAIAYAIDRQALIDHVFKGLVSPLKSFLAPGYFGSTTEGVPDYPYDPARARQLLSEAGVRQGTRLQALFPNIQNAPDVFTVVQAYLRQVGLQLELTQMEFGTWFDTIRSEQARNTVHLSWVPLGPRPADGDYPFSILLHSASFPPGLNFTYYDRVDDLIDAEKSLPNEERVAVFAELQRRVAEDVPLIPLFTKDYMYGARANVSGIVTGGGVEELELASLSVD